MCSFSKRAHSCRHEDLVRLAHIRRLKRCELSNPIRKVSLADDVIAIEDAPRLVPHERHRGALGHTAADEVPRRGAPQVVE
jgi:hypothetical protein